MTVSTSIGRELTIGEIWRRAYQLAGLYEVTQSLRDADKQLARDLSEGIVDELATYGVTARQRTFETVTCVSGTYTYTLSEETLDVIGDGMYIAASEADITKATGEIPVTQVDQDQWQRLSAKAATSVPTLFWANRVGDAIVVYYWPIPDEAGHVRHMVQRALADMNDENATMDLEPYWTQYIMWSLAHQLAEAASVPGSKIDRLQRTAMQKLAKARNFANPHTGSYMILDHAGGY